MSHFLRRRRPRRLLVVHPTWMPNMLAAEAAAADGQKLLSPVAPATVRPAAVPVPARAKEVEFPRTDGGLAS